MARLLIVEDDTDLRDAVTMGLEEYGHESMGVATASDALRAAAKTPFDVVLLDLGLPDRPGLEVLVELRKLRSEIPVIVFSGMTDMSATVCAMRDGAFEFVTKPVDPDVLEQHIARALRNSARRAEAVAPTPTHDESDRTTIELVGNSAAMREVYKQLGLLSASRATVLIYGESGTGKELAARILHDFATGPGTRAPFVAVNCAALPGPLVEAELFGYRRGAFTGADTDRAGKLEAAGEGTLFLDEIGEVPLEVQVKLLRVLQERHYERLGETESRPFKARVVTATHQDLASLIKNGRFREDLFFRLNVATLPLPSLRERLEDIPLVADRLLGQIAKELGRPVPGLSPDVIARLCGHRWPGNVRELRNVLTRAAVKSRGGGVLLEEDLDFGVSQAESEAEVQLFGSSRSQPLTPVPTLEEAERDLVRRALIYTQGHRGNTCALLGISRPTLLRKMKAYGLETSSSAP